jgi:hypothetical protein
MLATSFAPIYWVLEEPASARRTLYQATRTLCDKAPVYKTWKFQNAVSTFFFRHLTIHLGARTLSQVTISSPDFWRKFSWSGGSQPWLIERFCFYSILRSRSWLRFRGKQIHRRHCNKGDKLKGGCTEREIFPFRNLSWYILLNDLFYLLPTNFDVCEVKY